MEQTHFEQGAIFELKCSGVLSRRSACRVYSCKRPESIIFDCKALVFKDKLLYSSDQQNV